ncbi:MAG: site-specific integrase [Ruminococcus sp.]|nr:site-specific integrase [Ruminococcus sp.]
MSEKQIEKEVQRQAVMFEEACSHGMISGCVKFETFAEQWFEEYANLNHKDTTLMRERNLSRRTYKGIGHLRMDKITAYDVQMFINSLAKSGTHYKTGKGLSYKTIRHHLNFVSTIFDYAIKLDMLTTNPCKKVTIPKRLDTGDPTGKEKRIYTKEQAKEFLKILSESDMMYRVYFTLCMFTGCRRAELLGLEWHDFDYEQQIVRIVRTSNYSKDRGMYTDTPKTVKSNRIIALPPEIIELVKEFQSQREEYIRNMGNKWQPTERLFTCQDGHPMHSNTPYNWLKRLCDRNNFPFYGIHTFRHINHMKTSLLNHMNKTTHSPAKTADVINLHLPSFIIFSFLHQICFQKHDPAYRPNRRGKNSSTRKAHEHVHKAGVQRCQHGYHHKEQHSAEEGEHNGQPCMLFRIDAHCK